MKKWKCGTDRPDKIAHQDLIKRYKINFNPLLLPRLALLGYHLRIDPSFQVFLAKLQLFDKSAIQRENLFIQHMKQLMMDLERHQEDILMLEGIQREPRREIKSCINLEEDKHQYGKILKSRLTDLNELIFHVERLQREPLKEKECKNILEKEIDKISQIGYESRKGRDAEEERQIGKEGKQYFNLSQFKHNEMTKRIKDVATMLSSNRFERKYKKAKTEAFDDDAQDPSDDEEEESANKQTGNALESSEDEAASEVGEMFTNIQDKAHRKSTLKRRDTSSRISSTGIKLSRNLMQKAETEPNEEEKNMRIKKRQPGKSVRYNMRNYVENQVTDSEKNKVTSISNIRSSRSIIRSDKQSSRGTQSQILSKSRHFLQPNPNKKLTKIELTHEEAEHSEESEERAERSKSRVKTVKFSEQLIEQKNSYIKPKKYVRKFGRKETKLFLNGTNSMMDGEADSSGLNKENEGTESRKQLGSSKVVRRDGFQQQQQPNANMLSSGRSVARMKRKGRILGLQANRHLQRLLMEESIQQMLIDNELYDKSHQLFLKYKQRKNKGKYSSRKLLTDVNRSANRTRTGDKNDILFEIDLDDAEMEDSREYVSGEGFRVEYGEMKTMREKYVQIMPYHHKLMGEFYGGEHFECINHQFNTNENGKYYFNRLIMQNAKNKSADQYIPFNFPETEDKYESLRFDFSKQLSRELNNFNQKDLKTKSTLISYV